MIEQRTEEWKELRRGKFTASDVHKLMGIKGLGKTGETYILEKVAEELGATMPEITTFAMQWGIDHEPFAKRHYEKAFNCTVSDQPFIVSKWSDQVGCSPDGIITYFDIENRLLSSSRGLEIKCPQNPVNHVQNFLMKKPEDLKELRPEYYWQVQMCMWVTQIWVWDFVSYYPFIDDDYKMIAISIVANDNDIKLLEQRITEAVYMKENFLKELKLSK